MKETNLFEILKTLKFQYQWAESGNTDTSGWYVKETSFDLFGNDCVRVISYYSNVL